MSTRRGIVFGLAAFFLSILLLPSPALSLDFGFLLPNLNPAYGTETDDLYRLIFWLVTVIFFGTEGALIYFIFKYRSRPGLKAHYSHGNQIAEITWSVIPAIILVWLAFYQKDAWDNIRSKMPKGDGVLTVQSFPEQFLWNFRYPGPNGQFGDQDDVMTINQMHVKLDQKAVVHMTAKDVIHSFFVPFARTKQDAMPGMITKAWFQLDRIGAWNLQKQEMELLTLEQFNSKKVALEGYTQSWKPKDVTGRRVYTYAAVPEAKNADMAYQGKIRKYPLAEAEYVLHPLEIACAELCGLGHYKMKAYLTVDTPETYDWWMKMTLKEGARSTENKWVAIWDKYFPQYNTAQ